MYALSLKLTRYLEIAVKSLETNCNNYSLTNTLNVGPTGNSPRIAKSYVTSTDNLYMSMCSPNLFQSNRI